MKSSAFADLCDMQGKWEKTAAGERNQRLNAKRETPLNGAMKIKAQGITLSSTAYAKEHTGTRQEKVEGSR